MGRIAAALSRRAWAAAARLRSHFQSDVVTASHRGRLVNIAVTDRNDHIPRLIRRSGYFYERDLLENLARHVRPGETIVDVGANIGNHTAFFLAVIGAKVIAVEPQKKVFAALERTVALTGLADRATLYNKALGAAEGAASVSRTMANNIGATQVSAAAGGAIEMTTLDAICSEPVHCIKIDVEGQELEVLAGGRTTIDRDRPLLYIECFTTDDFWNVCAALPDYMPLRRFCLSPTILYVPRERVDVGGMFLK